MAALFYQEGRLGLKEVVQTTFIEIPVSCQVIYICVRGVDCSSLHLFLRLDYITVPTVIYIFVFHLVTYLKSRSQAILKFVVIKIKTYVTTINTNWFKDGITSISVIKFIGLHRYWYTVKPVLCDLPKLQWNMVTYRINSYEMQGEWK